MRVRPGDGEQVEAYVVRGRDTDVVVYDGGIESLSSADSEGVGIRVIADHREGFAYAGSLDPDVVRETLEEARERATASPCPMSTLCWPSLMAWRRCARSVARRAGPLPDRREGRRWPSSSSAGCGPATRASGKSRSRRSATPSWSRLWRPRPGSP